MKNGYFSVFCGSISHALSCKHETHDLLTLVSFDIRKTDNGYTLFYIGQIADGSL